METATKGASEGADSRSLLRLTRSPLGAGTILLVVYLALSLVNSPRGFLGTDEGGKVATLIVMTESGDLTPEVGYWAADFDPTARAHGLYNTSVVNGHYVNVTSLPMILAAEPLWRIGGYRMALLLPMTGAIAAAFAARRISQRVGGGDGWLAFWVVGLASPMLVYALDLWEHGIGVALMAWATVWLLEAIDRSEVRWRGLISGLLLGIAFTMRSEAAPYAVGFLGVACIAYWTMRKRLLEAVLLGASAIVGFVIPVVANLLLEKAVFGATIRLGRATGTVSAGGSDIGLRLREALVTLTSPFPTVDPGSYPAAVLLAVTLCVLVWFASKRSDHRLLVVLCTLVAVLYVTRLIQGVGFVPGLLATTPLAAVGVVLGWRQSKARLPVLFAVVPLPLVLLFQFPGGAAPQWAGRYILPSGLLLLAVGVGLLDLLDRRTALFMVGLSVVISVFGVVWLSVRSHDVARSADRLEALPEEVLISPDGFVPREFGGSYGRKRWLAVGCTTAMDDCEDLRFAVDVAQRSGASSFALVSRISPESPPQFEGWTPGEPSEVPFITDTTLHVTPYVRDASGTER